MVGYLDNQHLCSLAPSLQASKQMSLSLALPNDYDRRVCARFLVGEVRD